MIAFILTKLLIGLICITGLGTALGLCLFCYYAGTRKGRAMGVARTDADTDFVDTDFPPPTTEAQRREVVLESSDPHPPHHFHELQAGHTASIATQPPTA